jgi:predicted small lipoprotein YifL
MTTENLSHEALVAMLADASREDDKGPEEAPPAAVPKQATNGTKQEKKRRSTPQGALAVTDSFFVERVVDGHRSSTGCTGPARCGSASTTP